MTTIEKFMFDNRFDTGEPADSQNDEQPEEVVEQESVPPSYGEVDMKVARQEGFEAGKQDGYAAAVTSTEDQILSTLQKLREQIENGIAAQVAANETTMRSAVTVAAAIVSKMMPALIEKHGPDEVLAVVERAIGHLRSEPQIAIKVADGIADSVRDRISQLALSKASTGEITVIGDPDLPLGDCHLTWPTGEVVRDAADLQCEIDEIVRRYEEFDTPTGAASPEVPIDDPATHEQGSEIDLSGTDSATTNTTEPENTAGGEDLNETERPVELDPEDAPPNGADADTPGETTAHESSAIGTVGAENTDVSNVSANTP